MPRRLIETPRLPYRYRKGWAPHVIVLEPVPPAGESAMRFIVETYRIAWRIWGDGLSQNPIWTGGNSPLIFQHPDHAANLTMAREVIRRWELGEGQQPLSQPEAAGRYHKGKKNNQVATCLQAMETARGSY